MRCCGATEGFSWACIKGCVNSLTHPASGRISEGNSPLEREPNEHVQPVLPIYRIGVRPVTKGENDEIEDETYFDSPFLSRPRDFSPSGEELIFGLIPTSSAKRNVEAYRICGSPPETVSLWIVDRIEQPYPQTNNDKSHEKEEENFNGKPRFIRVYAKFGHHVLGVEGFDAMDLMPYALGLDGRMLWLENGLYSLYSPEVKGIIWNLQVRTEGGKAVV